MSFHDTLNARDRRLALRMESLGDVVVGFAMSQLVVHLPDVGVAIHVRNVAQAGVYFVSFAYLVNLWLNFHKLMSTSFVPRRLDLFLAFAYLAFTSLVPYAVNSYFSTKTGNGTSPIAGSFAIGVYAGVFFLTFLMSTILWWRNMRRGWHHFDTEERDDVWQKALRSTTVAFALFVALVVNVVAGAGTAGFWLAILIIAVTFISRRFKRAPSAAFLRIPAPAPAP
jgi:uncharacterized membrane protein